VTAGRGIDPRKQQKTHKFQRLEAPVVVVSLATSSLTEIPRKMEFLYSRNRLNVAVSRT